MSVPKEFIRHLVEAADIAEIVGERVQLQKRGSNLFGLCPFHDEKTPSFSVNSARGIYHCFGCGASGDVLSFVVKAEAGGDFMSGLEMLAQRLGMQVPRNSREGAQDALSAALSDAREYFCGELSKNAAACEYLEKRGISQQTVENFRIGYAPGRNMAEAMGRLPELLLKAGLRKKGDSGNEYDYFRRRIMFPIVEGVSRVLGFGGRVVDDKDIPKYLNSPETAVFSKRRAVFGQPQARQAARDKNRVIICEGYMDAVMLSQAGFEESVAIMGTAVTPQQMQKISRMADNVVFALDGDDAGREAAWRGLASMLPALKDGMSVSFLFLPPGKDPDDFVREYGADGFEEEISKAQNLGDYMASQLWKRAAAGSPEGRSSSALAEGERLVRLLDSSRAPYMREVMTRQLADKAQISIDAMRRVSERNARRAAGPRSRFRMRDVAPLYHVLCMLAARPELVEEIPENPPLPGQTEGPIVASVLQYLRWHKEDMAPDVIAYLRDEGYYALADQIYEYVKGRYKHADKSREEFVKLIGSIEDASRGARQGKPIRTSVPDNEWNAKIAPSLPPKDRRSGGLAGVAAAIKLGNIARQEEDLKTAQKR